MVGDTVPPAGIGRAMGLLGATSAIGTAVGPSIGGLLVAAFGWQSIFHFNAALGVAALLLAHRCLPRAQCHQDQQSIAFDPLGTLLLAVTLGAYALALTLGHGQFGAVNGALLLLAALAGGAFAFVEARVASPLVRLETFRSHRLTSGLAMSVIVSTVTMTTLVVGPFYLARALGLDAARTGLVIAAGPLAAAATGFPAGRLVDRLGAALMRLLGLIPMGIGCLLLATLSESLGVAGYVLPLVALTIGDSMFQTANMTAVLASVPAEQRGVTSGLLNLSRNLGLVTGASLMGAVFARASSAGDVTSAAPGAIAHGTRITFSVAAVGIVIAIVLAAAARRNAKASSEERGG
jgi:MFS family permease